MQVLRTPILLKRDSPTQVFSCKICQIFENILFYRPSPAAASASLMIPAATLLKKETPAKMFFCKFCNIFKNIFWPEHLQMTTSCVYLRILRSFSEHLSYRAPLRNCLFDVQFAEFQPPDTVKYYFTSAFQAFYRRTTKTHSKALKS